MGIEQSLEILKRAQEVDREIYALRYELDSIPDAIRDLKEEFEQEKSHLAAIEAKLKEIQLRQKGKEGELHEKETLVRKYDAQLMQVKTNREYSALQQEIQSLKADCSILEDAILTILDEVDAIQNQVQEERNRLAEREKVCREKEEELTQRVETLKERLSKLSRDRTEIMEGVGPEVRSLYDKIINKKEGLALVPVEGEACGGCRIELRLQVLNEVQLKETLVVCDNCSRILYIP